MNTKLSPKNIHASLFFNGKVLRALFKFFASLQLAVGTLSLLMIVLAAGTLIESRYGANAARILIYDTFWLTLILIVLVLNLAASAADRLPWQKKHIGFVLTHLGIIVLLLGSLATQKAAVDGQISLQEGASGKWVTLRDPVLYFYSQTFKAERMIALKERALRWKGREKIAEFKNKEHAAQLFVTQFFPKAKAETVWEPADLGVPAIQISLKNAFVDMTEWLADDAAGRELSLGPAVLRWADDFIQPAAPNTQSVIEIERGGKKEEVLVPEKNVLPFEQVLSSGIKIRILSVYRFAYVEESVLKEGVLPEHAENPAVVMEVEENGQIEKHTVFAHFPDFPTVHGKPESRLGVTVRYRDPHVLAKGNKNELRFVNRPDGIYYQIKSGEKLKQDQVVLGREVETGWMDLKFKVEQILPKAARSLKVIPLEDHDPSESATAALELEFKTKQEEQKFWLMEGMQKSSMLAGGLFEMVFGRRQLALGFEVGLKDFRVKNDPGTERAAAYESDVVLKDFTRGVSFEKTISMNQPLDYRGFKVYQAGYQIGEDGVEVSVFAVGRDPGIPMKYSGAVIMVLGIILMFYTRAYSLRNERGLK